jgi:membrane protein required for colicin V production
MNWLDIIILISLVASVIGGIATGLIRGLVSLAGLIIGIILAGRFYLTVAGWFGFISNKDIANIIAFGLILFVIMILAGIIGKALHAIASAILLGWLDHLAGGFIGLVMAFISWGTLLALWAHFFGGDAIANSAIAQVMLDKFPLVLALLPSQFDSVREFFN